QPAGDDDPARRAERADGAPGGAPGLRHPDRAHRAPRRGGRAAPLRPRAQDLPRREVGVTGPTVPLYLDPTIRAAPAQRRTVRPSRSTSGMRPVMRSATIRAVPHAMVQPMWPWPQLKTRFL